ncbi:uncharacterized protein LOC131068211 isoform X2 [Cryptomeria japonica]|nr:uncharacterized protein LOC131068211 isoform X2 [Cryptomeria japonica]
MPCPPCPEIQRNFQVAYESFNLEKIERRGLNILHALSSGYAVKRNHDCMTRLNSPEEEDFSSKRSRCNGPRVEKGGFIHEKHENAGAADQSDSTVKVSSGDSDLTAERMAEASSRTTSCSDNNGCTLNRPPSSATDASGIAIHQLSFIATENIQVTSSDSGFQKSNIEDCQTVHRSEGFSPSSSKLITEKDQEDWLALGLGCGHESRQPKHFSNSPHLDKTKNRKVSTISGNEDQNRDDHGPLRPQMLNVGHTSKSTTVFPQSSAIPGQLLSLHNTSNSFTQPPQQANDFSRLNLLQPCTMLDHQRSLNITEFPSVEQMKFNFERQQNGVAPRPSKGATHWQGFYDRISEVGNPIGAGAGVSEFKIAASHQGKHGFSPGWKSFVAGSVAASSRQNPSGDCPTYYGSLPDADVLQQAILEKMQCRVQWNSRDMSSSWYQPEISHGSLIRPSASEHVSGKIPRAIGMGPLGDHQYQMCATPVERSMPPDRYGELQKIPGPSWTENVRILRPPGSAQTGVWFTLQALNDRNGDRTLPQIRKNYLRIKDGSMTILVVKKYLVNKLGLNSESEIEIMCKGEELLEGVTLQHVRDVMWVSEGNENWKSKSVVSISISNHCSADHLMVLHYRRSRFSAPSATTIQF